MKKTLLLIFFFSGLTVATKAQQTYKTIHGDIAITIKDSDSAILLLSNQLLLLLDYETSKVNFHVGYETFETRIDSIDDKLRLMIGDKISFSGKIGITINTKNFAPQKYNMEGTLTSTDPFTPVRGTGSMTCLPTGGGRSPACTLLLSFETSLASLKLDDIFKGSEDLVRVDVRQSVLEKEDVND